VQDGSLRRIDNPLHSRNSPPLTNIELSPAPTPAMLPANWTIPNETKSSGTVINRAAALEMNAQDLKALATLSIYTQRLSRQIEKLLLQFRALQETQTGEKREPSDLVESSKCKNPKKKPTMASFLKNPDRPPPGSSATGKPGPSRP